MLENIICLILTFIWAALIISIIVEVEKKAKIRNARDEQFYRTIMELDSANIEAYHSNIQRYIFEDLYIQKHIKKIDPKELLLSKLKKE